MNTNNRNRINAISTAMQQNINIKLQLNFQKSKSDKKYLNFIVKTDNSIKNYNNNNDNDNNNDNILSSASGIRMFLKVFGHFSAPPFIKKGSY